MSDHDLTLALFQATLTRQQTATLLTLRDMFRRITAGHRRAHHAATALRLVEAELSRRDAETAPVPAVQERLTAWVDTLNDLFESEAD